MSEDRIDTKVVIGMDLEVLGNVVERWMRSNLFMYNPVVTDVRADRVVGKWQYKFMVVLEKFSGQILIEQAMLREIMNWTFADFRLAEGMPAPFIVDVMHHSDVPMLASKANTAVVFVTMVGQREGEEE